MNRVVYFMYILEIKAKLPMRLWLFLTFKYLNMLVVRHWRIRPPLDLIISDTVRLEHIVFKSNSECYATNPGGGIACHNPCNIWSQGVVAYTVLPLNYRMQPPPSQIDDLKEVFEFSLSSYTLDEVYNKRMRMLMTHALGIWRKQYHKQHQMAEHKADHL